MQSNILWWQIFQYSTLPVCWPETDGRDTKYLSHTQKDNKASYVTVTIGPHESSMYHNERLCSDGLFATG